MGGQKCRWCGRAPQVVLQRPRRTSQRRAPAKTVACGYHAAKALEKVSEGAGVETDVKVTVLR